MNNLAVPSSYAASGAGASNGAQSGSGAASSGSSGSASNLSQSDFLKLLTAQLQYQSPSNPADPTQLTSEFAAISQVNGINALNTKVGDIESNNTATQVVLASSLVGKQVAVSGDSLTADASGKVSGVFNLSSAAQKVTVNLIAPDGTVAGTQQIGPLSAGQQSFSFSGQTANSGYTYQVTATDSSGAAVKATTYSIYTVDGVNVDGSTPSLNVEGSSTPVPVSSIETVLGGTSS
jgi:flagellar basal-body rod modification protein FlgD